MRVRISGAIEPRPSNAEPVRFRSNLDNLQLTVDKARFDGGIYDAGQHVQFRAGAFRTADPKLIRFLRDHDLYGLKQQGFWEES